MTFEKVTISIALVLLAATLTGCGKDDVIETCDEIQSYQTIVPGEKVVVPDGLDPLEELLEMPIPKAQTAPRPAGSKCIDQPPSVLADK